MAPIVTTLGARWRLIMTVLALGQGELRRFWVFGRRLWLELVSCHVVAAVSGSNVELHRVFDP